MPLYIDPGTGSMLFTILIGLLGTAGFLLRNVFVRLRFLLSGGTAQKDLSRESLPFVIFSDHKRYWNTFEPICDEFERRGEALTFMTASPDDPALQKPYAHVRCVFIGEGNHAYAKLNSLRADILLSTTPGLGVYQWKRSRYVKWYVHVLHAANDPVSYRMFGLDYYDALLYSGEYQIRQTRQLEALRGLPAKEIELAGLPYLDKMLDRLEKAGPLPEHPKTVLLAPTWGKSGLLGRYGGKIIDAALATGYHIIVRPHPQSFISEADMLRKLMEAYPGSERLEWNRDNDNFEVLRRADIMVSDFSGVILDFCLVFQKPVIYADTSFDKGPYDAAWLPEEMWTFATLPRIGRQLTPDRLGSLKELIDEMTGDPGYAEVVETIREEAWVHRGEGAARIADYMLQKERELKDTADAAP